MNFQSHTKILYILKIFYTLDDIIESSWILMRYFELFQFWNLETEEKPNFEL